MGTLLSYSGLTTKIRAMESHLIPDEDYRRIAELATVGEVVTFLKKIPGYREVFEGVDETDLHRGEIERHLTDSIYWGFVRLYRFADQEQRKFLDLYFQRYEIFVVKRYLHRIEDHRGYVPKLGAFDRFFHKHTQLDLERMSSAATPEELVQSLEGTDYYRPLARLLERGDITPFDYEMTLDMAYFAKIWKLKDKLFSGQDLDSMTKSYGVKFDMLNLDWIFRSKKYYHLDHAEIYAMLIPMHHRLKKEEITGLVEASTVEEFEALLARTYYAQKYERLTSDTIEELYAAILRSTLAKEARNHPYSPVSLYSYLYRKEHEIDRLTTALECIRYHLDAQTTYDYIMRN